MRIFSGSDQFMQGGHQIINSNRARSGPKRKNSDWARSDKKVRELLLRAFPKLADNDLQRSRAARWARVINLYFRSGMSFGDTAAEMGLPKRQIEGVIRSIHRALVGKRANGTGFKNRAVTGTSLGDQ
jgi:hypothetical protein